MKANMAVSVKTPAVVTDSPKESYPYVCFRDKQVDKLEAAVGETPEVGDELTLTLTVKCTAVRKDENGKSVDFNVVSVDGATEPEPGDEEEPEETPEVKVKGVKNPAVGKAMAKMMAMSGKGSKMGKGGMY